MFFTFTNYTAHLVIIKGTSAWRGSGCGYQDLDAASLLQMAGRAGRPGFDTSGTVVIMTDHASTGRVDQLCNGLGPVESQLENKLIEVINSEISQQVIGSPDAALNWIKETLYFVQVRKNPAKFGIKMQHHSSSDKAIDAFLLYQCEHRIQKLLQLGLIQENKEYGDYMPLPASQIMASNLVDFQATELFVGLPFDSSQRQVLTALCQIDDLQRPVRKHEKKQLNEAHKDIQHKLLDGPLSKIRVQRPFQKAFVLLQACIGRHDFADYTLRQEMTQMVEYCRRMLTALEEYSAKGSKHGHVAAQSLKLRRSLVSCLWGEDDGVLNQIHGVWPKTTAALRMHGIVTFKHVQEASAKALEKAGGRPSPFGSQLKGAVDKLINSSLQMSAEVIYKSGSNVPDHITCIVESRNPRNVAMGQSATEQAPVVTYTLIAYADTPGSCLHFQDNISSSDTIKFKCPEKFGLVVIQLIASTVGLDGKICSSFFFAEPE